MLKTGFQSKNEAFLGMEVGPLKPPESITTDIPKDFNQGKVNRFFKSDFGNASETQLAMQSSGKNY